MNLMQTVRWNKAGISYWAQIMGGPGFGRFICVRKRNAFFGGGGGELVTIAELANLSGRAAVIGEREHRVGC